MFTHADSIRLRVSLLLGALTALVPATALKGRDSDLMLYTSWWPEEYHSGVFVVVTGAVLMTAIVLILGRYGFWKWWAFALTGAGIGIFPSVVYFLASLGHPEWLPLLGAMFIVGAIWGVIVITALFFILRPGTENNDD
jgi:hypothetical protein